MDAANGAATATISNGGTTVTPAARTAGDTLVGRNITDYTTPDATALRECHSGEQQHPCQRCEQTADKSAGGTTLGLMNGMQGKTFRHTLN